MIFGLFIIVILLFQGAISKYTGFSYVDEIVSLIFFLYFLYRIIIKKEKIERYEIRALFAVFSFFFIGVVSTIIYNYQGSISYGLESGLFSCKAFITYFGVKLYFDHTKINIKYLGKFLHLIETLLMISAVLVTINHFVPIFGMFGYKLGIPVTAYIFNHPTEVVSYAIFSLLISLFLREYLGYKRRVWRNYIPTLIVIFSALNYKSLGFITLFLALDFVMPFMNKFKMKYLIIGAPPMLLVVFDQLQYYFSDITSSRGALYYYGFKTAKDHFPFGSGFGTYGTEFSRQQYSPLYYKYHMNYLYGLSPNNPMYVADTMWPPIVAETGFFGLALIIFFFINLFLHIKNLKQTKRITMILCMVLVYGLIESVADSFFMNARGVTLFFLFAFFVSLIKKRQIAENNN